MSEQSNREARALAEKLQGLWFDTQIPLIAAALDEARAAERERCAQIADAEAADAYRNPRAANYRSPEMEKMAHYTSERIAKLIRARGEKKGEERDADRQED